MTVVRRREPQKRMSLSLSPDLVEWVRAAAHDADVSVSHLVAEAIRRLRDPDWRDQDRGRNVSGLRPSCRTGLDGARRVVDCGDGTRRRRWSLLPGVLRPARLRSGSLHSVGAAAGGPGQPGH